VLGAQETFARRPCEPLPDGVPEDRGRYRKNELTTTAGGCGADRHAGAAEFSKRKSRCGPAISWHADHPRAGVFQLNSRK